MAKHYIGPVGHEAGVLTLSDPRDEVLALTDPRGGHFLKTGQQGPCRPADRADSTDVVFNHTASGLLRSMRYEKIAIFTNISLYLGNDTRLWP